MAFEVTLHPANIVHLVYKAREKISAENHRAKSETKRDFPNEHGEVLGLFLALALPIWKPNSKEQIDSE